MILNFQFATFQIIYKNFIKNLYTEIFLFRILGFSFIRISLINLMIFTYTYYIFQALHVSGGGTWRCFIVPCALLYWQAVTLWFIHSPNCWPMSASMCVPLVEVNTYQVPPLDDLVLNQGKLSLFLKVLHFKFLLH